MSLTMKEVEYIGSDARLKGRVGRAIMYKPQEDAYAVQFPGDPAAWIVPKESLRLFVKATPKTLAEALAIEPGKPDPMKEQVGGSHYKGMAIQPMEYSMANNLDALQHTIVKYVSRFRNKNGIEDLKKARHAIDMLIAHEEKKNAI